MKTSTNQIKRCFILAILLLCIASSSYALNTTIARTGTPGNFWCIMYQYNGSVYRPWLALVENYGEDITYVYEGVSHVDYHVEMDVLLCKILNDGYFISNDSCQTIIEIENTSYQWYNWVPEPDSLVAFMKVTVDFSIYSRDTLRTYQLIEHEGLPERFMERTYCTGWHAEDLLMIVTITGNPLQQIYFSNTYGESFYNTGYKKRDDGLLGCYTIGLSPGTIIFSGSEYGIASSDTGRTWWEVHRSPTFAYICLESQIEYGWEPNELIYMGTIYDYYYEEYSDNYLFHSTNFGESWQPLLCPQPLMYPIRGYILIEGSRESYRIDTDFVTNVCETIPLELSVDFVNWTDGVEPIPESISFNLDTVIEFGDTVEIEVTASDNAFEEYGDIDGYIFFNTNTRGYAGDVVLIRGYIAESNVVQSPGEIVFDGNDAGWQIQADTIRNMSPYDLLTLELIDIHWEENAPLPGRVTIELPRSIAPFDTGFVSITIEDSAFADTGSVSGWLEIATNSSIHPVIAVDISGYVEPLTDVLEESPMVIEGFALHAVYPNPFNNSLTVSFETNTPGPVSILIYNCLGQQVYTDQVNVSTGIHNISLTDNDLHHFTSGIYFLQIRSNGRSQQSKIVYLK